MKQETEELIEEAEPAGEGLTNQVYMTDDKVIKVYSKYPFTSFYTSLLEILNGKVRYLNRETRMDNEVEMKEEVRKAGLKTQKVLKRGEDTIVFEKVPGESDYRYLDHCTAEEAEELGEKFRGFLENLHEQGSALRDARLSNFLINDEIYSIDHEYASLDTGKAFFFIDYLTVTASARQTGNFEAFARGFKPGKTVRLASFIASLLHATLLERDLGRIKKIFGN